MSEQDTKSTNEVPCTTFIKVERDENVRDQLRLFIPNMSYRASRTSYPIQHHCAPQIPHRHPSPLLDLNESSDDVLRYLTTILSARGSINEGAPPEGLGLGVTNPSRLPLDRPDVADASTSTDPEPVLPTRKWKKTNRQIQVVPPRRELPLTNCPDRNFLISMLPYFKNVQDNEKLELQIEFLNLLKKYT